MNLIERLIKYIAGIAGCLTLVGILFACSSEDIELGDDKKEEVPVNYQFAINVKIPKEASKTRAFTQENGTSSEGEEKAEYNENLINRAFIYLCLGDRVLMSLEANNYKPTSTGYELRAEVDIDELKSLAGKKLSVIVLANPATVNNQNIKAVGYNDAYFSVSDIDASPIGDFGNAGKVLPMINQNEIFLDLSNINSGDEEVILEKIWKLFENNNTYDLGTINLERLVARVEFKDVERPGENNLPTKAYTYKIGKTNIEVTLDHLQIFNVNTVSYLIRHTSEGNLTYAKDDRELFGKENGYEGSEDKYKWMAGYDWTRSGETFSKRTNYLNPISINDKNYSILGIDGSNSNKGIISIDELETRFNIENDGYHPWCYITENIIPSTLIMDDENLPIYATGLACSFVILGEDETPLVYSVDKENYPLGISNSGNDNKITVMDTQGYYQEVTPVDGKYYLTYYGYIKHNNPNNPSMSPMKYAVVRNNTYQLYVTKLNNLPNPEDPKSLYLDLTVNVKPWQKRENNYDF